MTSADDGSGAPPFRRPVGGGFFVTSFPGDGDRLLLDSPFPVDAWKPRPPAAPSRPDFPGSAIGLERPNSSHVWWEIVGRRVQAGPEGEDRVVYELRPWPEGQVVRGGFELTPESARRLTAEYRAGRRRQAEAQWAAYFMPFYGLLPGAEQEEIESRYGLAPGRATLLTASLLLLLSAYGLMLVLASAFGAGGADVSRAADFKVLLGYLFFESLVRLSQGAFGTPVGSALVTVPLAALRALAGRPRTDEVLPQAPTDAPPAVRSWLDAEDVVKRLPPSDEGRARLEVLSPLPKEHWRANVDLIRFDGTSYVLEEREAVPGGHRFRLEEPPPGIRNTRAVHDYSPTEVRDVYKELRRVKAEAWLETLAPLVGLTEPALQTELAEIYRYRPYKAVAMSVLFGLLFGLVSLRTGWVRIHAGADSVLMIVYGVLLLWENGVRGVRLLRGELTPSVLGRLVSPLARKALRWRHDPSWPYPPTS